MTLLWLFVGVVAVFLALLAWLERRDARVLRDHLRDRYPVRLSNSFWGALDATDGEPEGGAGNRHVDADDRAR